jgi:hypothetical protein
VEKTIVTTAADPTDATAFGLGAIGTVAGVPFNDAFRYLCAVNLGLISTANTAAEVYADFSGDPAVTVSVDTQGNRTGVVLS